MRSNFKKWFSVRENQIILIIFLFALFIRLKYAFISGLWWDEARYAEFGRELLQHPLRYESVIEGGGPIILYSPMLPYLLFLSQLILGAGDFAVRIVNPILGAIGVFAIYHLGKVLYNKKTGLIAASLLSVSSLYWFLNERILMETPETVFMIITLALFYTGIEKNNKYALWSAGFFGAIGYLSRMSLGFLGPIMLIYLIITRKTKWIKNKNIWIAVLIGLLVLTPWMIRNMPLCGNPFCELGSGIQTISPTPAIGGGYAQFELVYWVKQFPSLVSLGVFLFFVFGLIQSIQDKKKQNIFVLIWFAMYLLAATQLYPQDPRRIAFLISPIIIIASSAIYSISNQLKTKKIPQYSIILLILLPLMFFSFQQGQSLILNKAGGFTELKEAGMYLEELPSDTKILANSLNQIAFYSGAKNTTNYFPKDQNDLEKTIKEHDYDYIVIDGYERVTVPSWLFSFTPPDYLELQKVISQNDQPIAFIFKINKEKLS